MRIFFHVDLDAFYAAVEVLDHPSLAGRPVVVGALPGHRGVVSSCSYEARRFGVRSAMPISRAQRLCPQAVFLPVRMSRYVEVSQRVMALLRSFTPDLQQISVDEASLDMTGTSRLFGPPAEAGRRIKTDVLADTGLRLSIGIAGNRYLSKLASERSKPDGLLVVNPGEETAFLDGLELERLWGVGERTRQRLRERLAVTTVRQLRELPQERLCATMGEASGRYLYRAVRGLDPGIYSVSPKSHSVSSETTFEVDVSSRDTLQRVLLELSEELMHRTIREELKSTTVVLKLRLQDFTTTTAQKNVRRWLTSSDELHALAIELLKMRWDGSTPVRLIGLGLAGVVPRSEPAQGELFDELSQKKRRVEEAVSRLREKISGVRITRASLLPKDDGNAAER